VFASVRIGAEGQCRCHWFALEVLVVKEREEEGRGKKIERDESGG
jgi:hypothetical protein